MAKQTESEKQSAKQAEAKTGKAGKKMGKKEMQRTSVRILRIAWHVFFTCAVILVLYVLIVEGYAFGKALFTENAASASSVEMEVTITEGQSALQVGKQLQRMGLIESGMVFYGKSLLFEYTIYPGTYTLSPSMTDREILAILSVNPDKKAR